MCDCYTTSCEGCDLEDIPVHIGDYSQNSRNVHVFCPLCHQKALALLSSPDSGPWLVFADLSSNMDPDSDLSSNMDPDSEHQHLPEGVYLFVVMQPHGVHLN
jgi:hypothetical protein